MLKQLTRYIGNYYKDIIEMMEDIRSNNKVWRGFLFPEYIPTELAYRILCFDCYRPCDKAFIYYVDDGEGIRIYKIEGGE